MARFNWHSCCSIKSVSWVGNARYRLVICSKSSTGMQEGKEDGRSIDDEARMFVLLELFGFK